MFRGTWIGESPEAPPNRAGDYPGEYRYEIVPHTGRYRGAGIRGVPRSHVELVCRVLDRAAPNPHCAGIFEVDNWIDCDLPDWAIQLGSRARSSWLRGEADSLIARAERMARTLRADADDLVSES